jgi:hypothetical protein
MVDGTTKLAKYWSAQAVGEPTGKPNPQEVDEILWLSPADARKKLTLDDDRSIVDFFCEFGTGTTPLVLLRHAKAIKREDWDGDDGDRDEQFDQSKKFKAFNPFTASDDSYALDSHSIFLQFLFIDLVLEF